MSKRIYVKSRKSQMIPKKITRHHVIEAIKKIEKEGIPKKRMARLYALSFRGKKFPPKYVISVAAKLAIGRELTSEEFEGGKQTNTFLRKLGFKIIETAEEKEAHLRPQAIKKTHHNERCPECKRTILRFLKENFGEAEQNYRFDVGTKPEDFRGTPFYKSLVKIYKALQNYRGFKNFVKTKTLPHCDFFVPNPGLVVEFDESQHFTLARKIALENYPEDIKLGFDKKRWIGLCEKINAKDNNPPYRDEQRAWYDTLRDFALQDLRISVVRLYSREHIWCTLDAKKKDDIQWFQNLINKKLSSSRKAGITKKTQGIQIGLAFPELKNKNHHNIHHFLKIIQNSRQNLDLIIFPEGYESIETESIIHPEFVEKNKEMMDIIQKYSGISRKFNLSLILGISIDYKDTSISGGGNDQYCLFVTPSGKKALYHKHSTSKFTAFFDSRWSLQNNFPVLNVKDKKVGISICHDSYISLIPRILKTKGADIWVNISFQNVRTHIWEAVLQTRATENNFISICTLHRNSKPSKGEGKPQKEPYAFSKEGKIELRELTKNLPLEEIPPEKRTGKIYYFNTGSYETFSTEGISESNIPQSAITISITKDKYGSIKIIGGDEKFVFEKVSLKDFIFKPETLWKLSLKNFKRDKITLFSVLAKSRKDWERHKPRVEQIIKGRVIEFSTLFVFLNKKKGDILLAAYRSSNYKSSRIFFPYHFPFRIDKRFLKGMESIFKISFDNRKRNKELYFKRISKMINYLQRNEQIIFS